MIRLVLFAALALVLAGPAGAGAWPRGEGRTFVALSYAGSPGRAAPAGAHGAERADGYASLFAERGLTPRLTFGLDAGGGEGRWTALAFLRRSYGLEGPNVWGAELGLGRRGGDGDGGALIRPGLHWGRGAPWGWMGVESYAEIEGDGIGAKLDATLGLRRSDRVFWVLQLQTARTADGDGIVRLAPSYVRQIAPPARLELGFLADLSGEAELGVKLGTWVEF